jgi:hypothetical protein
MSARVPPPHVPTLTEVVHEPPQGASGLDGPAAEPLAKPRSASMAGGSADAEAADAKAVQRVVDEVLEALRPQVEQAVREALAQRPGGVPPASRL